MIEKFTFDVDEVFARLGYDPEDPVRGRDIPDAAPRGRGPRPGRRGSRMTKTSLAQALHAFQKDAPPIHLDATNPHFHSKFVSLAV
jgi:hypothetical protein